MGGQQLPVTVGVDGGPATAAAIRWGLAESRTRRVPLRLVHVYGRPALVDGWDPPGSYAPYARTAAAGEILADALVSASGRTGDLRVSGATVEGERVPALLAESARADLMVVGTRGLGRLTGAVLGSVSSALAAAAYCPVIVVRGRAGYPEGHVVVGIDGGEETDRVLEFAFDHASRYGLPLRPVWCRRPPPGRLRAPDPGGDSRDRATTAMLDAVASWQDKYPDVPVERVIRRSHAVDGLLEEGLQASLVVVGARGDHAHPGFLLGSVSQGVLHHATSPVAVVRTERLLVNSHSHGHANSHGHRA
jgi:nucleotide-binding universal stress UspA family protein